MRFISASQVFSGKEFLKENTVLVLKEDGTITDFITSESIDNTKIEHYNGILIPGFINTHCHLELSHLKDKISRHTGIVDFGLSVIKHRNAISAEQQQEYMLLADKTMKEAGIVAVGDISNSALSADVKRQSKLYYHTFVELIGLNPERANLVFEAGTQVLKEFESKGLSASLTPHAPYSSSLDLIKKITDTCAVTNKPSSIHNQESKAENDFFMTKTGNYLKLYETLNLPITYFTASGKSSLQTVLPAFHKAVNTLLVHNTFTSPEDIEIAQKHHPNLYWCLCPNANLYIENTLPDTGILSGSGCTLTLGTDSLASNSDLSIINEINCLLANRSKMPLELLLKAATYNGALFLGIENSHGLLEKGKRPGINVLSNEKGSYSVKVLA